MYVYNEKKIQPQEKKLCVLKVGQKKMQFWSHAGNFKIFQNSFCGIKGPYGWHKTFIKMVFVLNQVYGHQDCFSTFHLIFGPKLKEFISLK